MKAIIPVLLLTAGVVSAQRGGGRDADAKILEKLQGTWTFESYEEGGKKETPAALKDKRIFFGGRQFMIIQGEKLLQVGVLKLDPLDGRRDIDLRIVAGPNKDSTLRGIYHLKGDTLKVCIDPDGENRPADFKTNADSDVFVAVYKRIPPVKEEIDILGSYKGVTVQIGGDKLNSDVKIERLGDCYKVTWSRGILNSFVGIGIRTGNLLSVTWATGGGQGGVSAYRIEKGPRLVGDWTVLGGTGMIQHETLTARKVKK